MNDEQRKQFRILWYQGDGYKKIAASMDLSRDVIRGYCKRHGLDGRATNLVLNQDEDEKFIREITHVYCLSCGSKLEQKGRGAKKKYCSIECKRKWEKIILKYINGDVIIVEKNIYPKGYRSESFVIMTATLEVGFLKKKMQQKL